MLIDSHCHIDFDSLADDLDTVLANAATAGVSHMLCVSVRLEDFPRILRLAVQQPHIFASVGVHPNERDGHDPDIAELVDLGSHRRVVAVGETGLDYFRSDGESDWQRQRFERHIEAARALDKPLIIHSRAAADDTMQMLRTGRAGEPCGVMHCFAEDWNIARQALDIGFYISFSGIVTFNNARAIQDVARKAPLDRILVETDAPYLAPVPHRGKTNEPALVRYTAQYVAKLRNISFEQLATATTDNFFTLFRGAQAVPSEPGLK